LGDQVIFARTFQAAIAFELIVLEWAFSKGYPRKIGQSRKGQLLYPSFAGAVRYLENDGTVPPSLLQQIKEAWETRNDLVHNFAWKSLLLGPEQSKDHILYESHKILTIAWFAVHDAWRRGSR